jgi:hypothetical protein
VCIEQLAKIVEVLGFNGDKDEDCGLHDFDAA